MNKDQIINLVTGYIAQSIQGLEIEHPKFDFKSKWYDLNSKPELSEFLKDTSAIVNTFGPDGFIVIGFNNKTKAFTNSPFANSGLLDTSRLPDLINKYIDRQFTMTYYETSYEENIIGILHIPPSLDKPHFIRNHKVYSGQDVREEANKVFIRHGSQTRVAGKYDLELMIYDRKNITPEYELHCTFHKDAFKYDRLTISQADRGPLYTELIINMENSGRRPVSICGIKMTLSEFEDPSSLEIHIFTDDGNIRKNPFIIQPGNIEKTLLGFSSGARHFSEKRKEIFDELKTNMHLLKIKDMTVTLTNGQILPCTLTIIK